MKQKNIFVYVMGLPPGAVSSIRKYEKAVRKKFRIMLIMDSRTKHKREATDYTGLDILLYVDFSRPGQIAQVLLPYQEQLLAITCRTESHMLKFMQVIPHVPYLRTPTTESLEWSTDKLKMRRRFILYNKKITPKFCLIKGNTKTERAKAKKKIGFPMIVKPTNLAQSMLVTICYHEEDLEKSLRSTFRKIKKIYEENKRDEQPQVVVEEYMEGDMYSIDGYVNSRGTVYFCPMVKVVTGKNIGHDDFYNYLHLTPTAFKKSTIERAERVAEMGVHALGLRNTTVHVELMKIDDEWKIVEIGPRVGGFRVKLHELSCGIDHSLNDLLIRVPKQPVIPKKCSGFAAALKWYPKKEGIITKLKGIKKCQKLASFVEISVNKKVGDRCHFAKNGGKAVFVITLHNYERSKLLADIRRVEQLIDIKIK